ncbi:hypothetical protein C0995_012214 [Termitomyces sp. Mi166|nr:hypothetical protein C0995_012214 [Termitomyces sp. Mi166\
MINPDWTGRDDNAASEVEQVPSAPPAESNQEKNGQKPPMRHKSLPGVLVEEPDRESSDEEEDEQLRSTFWTALSTATLAESVNYDAIRHQRVPVIAEAMDMLNALQQANKSQQNFERRQNAACQQATASGVPLWALSEVETATSEVVDKEEFEILQSSRMPRRRVMIKEEVHECTVPEETVTS